MKSLSVFDQIKHIRNLIDSGQMTKSEAMYYVSILSEMKTGNTSNGTGRAKEKCIKELLNYVSE